MSIPAVVTAGDRRAAKAVYGESKVYLEIGGRPLVAHVVLALQGVPEIDSVWVVGNAERLRAVFDRPEIRARLTKPLRVVPQFRNLYENAWETYRRLLPGAGPEGRDPETADLDARVLYLSADLPFATPHEITDFVRKGLALDCDYALGLVTEESMAGFYPRGPGEPGIRMAYFAIREGRLRQSNLHLVKPARIGNRWYIEEMYEHRYQKQFGNMLRLGWTILRAERGGFALLYYYALMHLASIADRRGWRRLCDLIRSWIPVAKIEAGCSRLLRCSYRKVITEVGGCAVDIDNEHDFDVARQRYQEWSRAQLERGERLIPLALPSAAGQESA